jgi:hypothetical protein
MSKSVQSLICLKSKYLSLFSARWVFRHAGMAVERGVGTPMIFEVPASDFENARSVSHYPRCLSCRRILLVYSNQTSPMNNKFQVPHSYWRDSSVVFPLRDKPAAIIIKQSSWNAPTGLLKRILSANYNSVLTNHPVGEHPLNPCVLF